MMLSSPKSELDSSNPPPTRIISFGSMEVDDELEGLSRLVRAGENRRSRASRAERSAFTVCVLVAVDDLPEKYEERTRVVPDKDGGFGIRRRRGWFSSS